MKQILALILFGISYSYGYDYKTDVKVSQIGYSDFSDETLLSGNTKVGFNNEVFATNLNIEYLYSTQYDKRRYIMLNELYLRKEYQAYSLSLGKMIKFWGEMEGYNFVDIFNQKNYLYDPFDKGKKLGAWAFSASKYINNNAIEFNVKFHEEDQKFPNESFPYYPFPIVYSSKLRLSDSEYQPTFYLTYNFSTDAYIESETKLIVSLGYDNKRYFIPINQTLLSQFAYRVNKYLFLSNIVYDDMIIKMEAAYTDVNDDQSVSDYYQFAFGGEKTFYDVFGADLSVYCEYYRYGYTENKLENVDVSEIYNNDLFLALKLNFNDTGDTEIKSGIFLDLDNQETVFKIETKSRIKDSFVISGELLRILPKDNTLLSSFGKHTRALIGLSYTF
ncbi:hypothetical protein PGH07_04300 [Sulfurovum sp. zt1-1]|uniref:Porin n=1 Tax=Sulfurovum zhangzhouensis TaxID=3019067 RepID=A0ABT7QXW4_9BACT|nr:hypothetical protein [Sulfurovum zhangzhouensis]MDM5271389.1 hypothetical protein [Sulfurovum zhangzhouensis]